MHLSSAASVLLLIIGTINADQKRFNNYWYDGNAEISTYELSESRYGELRQGFRVMVVVTEPMRLSTHIKPDRKLPDDQKVRVIKLNDLRKFTTGIYDYSVMTSVFSTAENRQPFGNMATMKVAFSSQEWCGQVFDRMVRTDSSYEGVLYSYFESEGESSYSFNAAEVETEDNLWLRVRELNGRFLNEGETRTLNLIPSRWITRKNHTPTELVSATITRAYREFRQTSSGTIEVVPFTWKIGNSQTIVRVEAAYPHRIVEFSERDGSSGKLLVSEREPYWKQNAGSFTAMRQHLGLP